MTPEETWGPLIRREQQKRETHWDAAERWRVIQETIAWAEAQATVPRNSPQRCLQLQARLLARLRNDPVPVAERFELYLGGIELANGFHELADAAEQRSRFEADNRLREQWGLPVIPLDESLLGALATHLVQERSQPQALRFRWRHQ